MNCTQTTVLDLSGITVKTDSYEREVMSLFPVDQDGKRMLDYMMLASTGGRTYVVTNPEKFKREKKAEPIGWNVDFRRGARF